MPTKKLLFGINSGITVLILVKKKQSPQNCCTNMIIILNMALNTARLSWMQFRTYNKIYIQCADYVKSLPLWLKKLAGYCDEIPVFILKILGH